MNFRENFKRQLGKEISCVKNVWSHERILCEQICVVKLFKYFFSNRCLTTIELRWSY